MFRLLSDIEVALNELLVRCRESIDHYEDAAKLVDQPAIAETFLHIASNRKTFLSRLESAIKELGDLPSMPDPDKEAGEMIFHHIDAALSEDYTQDALTQRANADEQILSLINDGFKATPNPSCTRLLNELSQHVHHSLQTLNHLSIDANPK